MVLNREKEAVGVLSSHIDDILGCGAPGVPERTRYSLEQRFGTLKVLENAFLRVGMGLEQKADLSVDLSGAEFTKQRQALWRRRQGPLSDEEKLLRQRKMGELRWLATVSWPDI